MAQTVLLLIKIRHTDATAGGLNIASNLIKFQNAAGSENFLQK